MHEGINNARDKARARLHVVVRVFIRTDGSASLDEDHRRQSGWVLYVPGPVAEWHDLFEISLEDRELLDERRALGTLVVITPTDTRLVEVRENGRLGKTARWRTHRKRVPERGARE